ncbi:MAG: phospholipid carrier-dependent glycosyltransferase [bacterium]
MRIIGPGTLLQRLEHRLQGPPISALVLALGLLLLCGWLFFYRLGSRDLWAPDEPRYAQVAREMIERSDWLVPYLNGELYTQKPMMYFWLEGAAGRLFGDVTPLAARLPSALAATAIALGLFLWGTRRLGGAGRAWMAAAVLSTSAQFLWVARFGQMDLVFAAFVFFSLIGGYETLRGQAAARYRVLFYAAMAAATLTKGPVAVLLCWLGPLVACAARREWRSLARLKPQWGMPAVAAVVAAWYVPAVLSTDGAYGGWEILWKQTYRRAVHGYSHPKWFGYYLYDFPAIFLPWSLWLPAAWIFFQRRSGSKWHAFVGPTDAERYLMGFFFAAFLFFSFSTEKRGNYLLPLFPAAAVYAAGAWPGLSRVADLLPGKVEAAYRWLFGFFALILLLAAPGLLLLPGILPAAYRPDPGPLPFFSSLSLLAAVGFAWICRRRLWRTGWLGLVLLPCALVPFQSHVVDPVVNPHKSARYMCERLVEERARGAEVISYIHVPPQFIYYSKGPIRIFRTPEEIVEHMRAHPRVLLLMEEPSYRRFQSQLEQAGRLIEKRGVGHRTMVLLSNYLNHKEPAASEVEGTNGPPPG